MLTEFGDFKRISGKDSPREIRRIDTEYLQGLVRAGEFVMNISGEFLVTNSRELLVIRNILRYSQHIPESPKLENLSLTFVTWVALFKNSRLSGLTSTLES